MIHVENLRKVFPDGTKALDGVNLSVESGEFVCVLGRSGAGKSTLMRCLLGLIPVTSGRIRVAGHEVTGADWGTIRKIRRKVGCVFQQFNLVGRLTVLENVLIGRLGYYSGWSSVVRYFPAEDRDAALFALEKVGLIDKAFRRADTLSGGQQQRVAVARALFQQPQIMLADEPVSNLDPRLAETILGNLRDINESYGVTTIANLHTVELARAFGQRVVGLREGKVVYDGSMSELDDQALERIYGGTPEARGSVGEDEAYDCGRERRTARPAALRAS